MQLASTGARPITPGYLRYALSLLLVVNILNFVDRQIVSILAEQIKTELELADWQLGALTGIAFALFYTSLGIPIARLAERADRRLIIAGSIVGWSGFTMLCGAASNFAHLLLARMGVGLGEAGCTPAAHSLIGDYTPKEKRASALAFYSMGTPLGSVLGLALGGLIADAWGWRMAFILCGAPGIVIGLIVFFTLREPRRGALIVHADQPGFREAFRELRGKKTFWLLALGTAMTGIVGYGGGQFVPSFFFRNHGSALAEMGAQFGMQAAGFLGVAVGITAGAAGLLGTWIGGRLADRHGPGRSGAYALIPAIAALLWFPFFAASVMAPSLAASIVLLAFFNFFVTIWSGPVLAGVQSLVHPRTRATASAVLLLIVTVVGLGVGPLIVGALSDFFAGPLGLGAAEGVRWALGSIATAGAAAAFFYWRASRIIASEMV